MGPASSKPKEVLWRKYALTAAGALVLLTMALFACIYLRCAQVIDASLRRGSFPGTADIYAANPPRLVMNLSDRNRESRKIVRYGEIPKVLKDAVISVEDKRFFHHNGLDLLRMLKAAYVDLRDRRKNQGASTLSMQLVRNVWLARDKSWTRKVSELAMALRLEEKLTKEQIFEFYCNQVYLGRHGTFNLQGFGAAAEAYFGKDVGDLTLPEAATLAGLIQRPSYFHPYGSLDRLRERRNLALAIMRRNGVIGEDEYRRALKAPVSIVPSRAPSNDAPYFIDLVSDELQDLVGEAELKGGKLEVYTTLDLDLERAAEEALRIGMQNVDRQLARRGGQAQAALIALDPHTGEVKALVGGRNYNASQLNRVLSVRQPGSVFKPFVYAAALNTAIGGKEAPVTPATLLDDEPTTFQIGNVAYTPGNFHHASYGEVTVREALAKSINVPTVKLAQIAGYGAVATLAKQAGLGDRIQATPSIALGSYDSRPLDVAGAYTVFANGGVYVRPGLISQIKAADGTVMYSRRPETRPVLDPRVAYLMVNLLEGVMSNGTAAGVRSRGFTAPAAGKTGTSRDGWFAGFTSQLICVVWVGFDDNQDLKLEGAKSALPIWTEFMKRATTLAAYRDPKAFRPPPGISSAYIDPETGELATPECPSSRPEFFIAGTEPSSVCARHRDRTGLAPVNILSQ